MTKENEAKEEVQAEKVTKKKTIYTARGGETLARVAGLYGVKAEDLAKANKLEKNAILFGGQAIIIK